MGWFGSIHVRMQSVEPVAAALRVLKQVECYVGSSGAGWVGVYDKRNEDNGGSNLTELSRNLSLALGDVYVLGFLQGEDRYSYCLYRSGQQSDIHPPSGIEGLLFVRRAILDLCPTQAEKDRVLELLEPKRVATPVDYRMTDEELRLEIKRNKYRMMSARQQVKKAGEQRKIYRTDRFAMEIISKILGIEYFWLLYSDFSPYDLPPTFVHIDCFGR